jgi:adenylate kinase family enzyme
LEDLTRILDYTNETLIIIENYRGRLHPVLARTFILDDFGRIEELARAYASYVGATTMRALCDELRGLLEEWG